MAGDSETQELCVNCGMPPCKRDDSIPITLLFSKATRQVLCVEAGKDFVDTLIGFLTLPVGRIIKFLEGASMIHRPECKVAPRPSTTVTFPPGCPYSPAPRKGKTDSGEHFAMSSISNILQSVAKLDDKEMMVEKNCLVDPKPATPFGAGKLLDSQSFISSGESTQGSEVANYYGCGNVCCFLTSNSATKCPKHKKKMNIPFKIVERNVASQSDAIEGSDEIPQVRLWIFCSYVSSQMPWREFIFRSLHGICDAC